MGARQVRRTALELEAAASELVVADVAVVVAGDLVEVLARCERVVSALRVRLGRRVTEAGGHRARGDRDAASFLARVSGSPLSRAKAELELAGRLDALPEVQRAYDRGRLSTDQAQVVAGAAEVNPTAADALLDAASTSSFAELRAAALRAGRAARSEADEVTRERRVHARRFCRTWTPDEGGVRIDAHLPTCDGAKLLSALAKKTGELMEHSDEPADRLRADALVALCAGDQVRTELLVRTDAAALVRGEVEGNEVCEVLGVGPISVTTARSLLGEAFLTLLVTKGADIATVTSTTRAVPRKVRMALAERDRTCVVPGCGASLRLEIDHWREDFAKGGMTQLDNLCRLCSVHHKMKTDGRLHLGGGPGRWFITTPALRARAGP